MRVLSFPLRIESGSFSTVEQFSDRQGVQLAQMIVGTRIRERDLAPDFGVFDPVGVGVSESEVRAAVALCEPDLEVTDVAIASSGDRQSVTVGVRWVEDSDGV